MQLAIKKYVNSKKPINSQNIFEWKINIKMVKIV